MGEQAETVEWGYAGAGAPQRWADLSADYAACAEGASQSPIDIVEAPVSAGTPPTFDYAGRSTEIARFSHSVHTHFDERNRLSSAAGDYRLLQIHWHTPSEHRIAGRSFPMELHLVHQRESGEIAVVGILYEVGAADPAIQRLLDAAPAARGDTERNTELSGRDFQPDGAAYYAYNGSLTTPPCTEGVAWFIMRERRAASPEQIAALSEIIGGENNRPLQPLSGRSVALLG